MIPSEWPAGIDFWRYALRVYSRSDRRAIEVWPVRAAMWIGTMPRRRLSWLSARNPTHSTPAHEPCAASRAAT
jgi:hypothetical protein